jgi:dTDP-glucose pyrophosphorylase
MTTPELVSVILAGGRGARMEPFSARYPKPLLPVLDRPVIAHQIAHMTALGVRDVVVVVGHLGSVISETLGDGSALGVRIRYVEQGEPLGIAHALGKAEPFVDRPFLLTLGDIFFVPRGDDGLARMASLHRDADLDGVLAVKEETDDAAIRRNFAVVLADDGTVRRVIEKPSHPRTMLKGCGVYLFDPPIFDAIRRTPRTTLRDEYELTDAIQIFIDDGHRVGTADVIEWDVNLTFPKDLWLANARELARTGQRSFVAESAEVGPGAVVDGSVIGGGAVVRPGVRVLDSVVFPGTVVDHDAVSSVLTPDARLTFAGDS